MIGTIGLERTVQITENYWIPAIVILVAFAMCFGLLYLIGWLVMRKRNNGK